MFVVLCVCVFFVELNGCVVCALRPALLRLSYRDACMPRGVFHHCAEWGWGGEEDPTGGVESGKDLADAGRATSQSMRTQVLILQYNTS